MTFLSLKYIEKHTIGLGSATSYSVNILNFFE